MEKHNKSLDEFMNEKLNFEKEIVLVQQKVIKKKMI